MISSIMADAHTQNNAIQTLLERRVTQAYPSRDEAIARLSSDKPLVFYFGIDPTGSSVHIGHTVPLLLLKGLHDVGHKIILLIGDFTARIGDPTDKLAVRSALTADEVQVNMATYLEQVNKILPEGSYEVRYNSQWLSAMTLEDIVHLTGHFTVQQMLERDMFDQRIQAAKPIYLHEFLYPLFQGYDSVALDVDGEVGGSDQTFNMLMGRELQKIYHQKDKLVLTTRLLEDPTTGKKISKSEGNSIGLNESPQDIFGKIMAMIPDTMIITVFELCTEVSRERINALHLRYDEGENPKNLKEELAFELVRMYYDETEAQKAKEEFNSVFSEGQLPKDIPEYRLGDKKTDIVSVLSDSGIIMSKSEIKRLIQQGGIAVNSQVIEQWDYILKSSDIIKIGSHRFLKII